MLPNCEELNQVAKLRINACAAKPSIAHELFHTEMATKTTNGYELWGGYRLVKN